MYTWKGRERSRGRRWRESGEEAHGCERMYGLARVSVCERNAGAV